MEQQIKSLKIIIFLFAFIMILTDITIMIIGFKTKTLELFKYQECSYNMVGDSICLGKTLTHKCLSQMDQECDLAIIVVKIQFYANLIPAIYNLCTNVIMIISYCLKSNFIFLLRLTFLFKYLILLAVSGLFFYAANNTVQLGNMNDSVNGQIIINCIVQGILSILSVFYLYLIANYINILLKGYETQIQTNNIDQQVSVKKPVDQNQIKIKIQSQQRNHNQIQINKNCFINNQSHRPINP